MCHSFSSLGSSRPSCSVPSPRELLLTARASFLPSRPYLARMTRREAGCQSRRVLGVRRRAPGFVVTSRDQAEQEHEQTWGPASHSYQHVQWLRGRPPNTHWLLWGSHHQQLHLGQKSLAGRSFLWDSFTDFQNQNLQPVSGKCGRDDSSGCKGVSWEAFLHPVTFLFGGIDF